MIFYEKNLIAIVVGIFIFNLVSCENKNVDQNTISNKYPIDEYLKKGATLEKYESNGTAVMKDTNGEKFFAGYNSTYKVELSDDGIVLPYIVVGDTLYYFKNQVEDEETSDKLKKSGRINAFGGNLKKFIGEINSNIDYIQSLTVYTDNTNSSLIYTKYKGIEGYQVWSDYKKQ